MAKKVFKPSDWLEQPKKVAAETVKQEPIVLPGNEQIEQVIQEIECQLDEKCIV